MCVTASVFAAQAWLRLMLHTCMSVLSLNLDIHVPTPPRLFFVRFVDGSFRAKKKHLSLGEDRPTGKA